MGFPAQVPQCGPIRVTYAPARRHAHFGHFASANQEFEGLPHGRQPYRRVCQSTKRSQSPRCYRWHALLESLRMRRGIPTFIELLLLFILLPTSQTTCKVFSACGKLAMLSVSLTRRLSGTHVRFAIASLTTIKSSIPWAERNKNGLVSNLESRVTFI